MLLWFPFKMSDGAWKLLVYIMYILELIYNSASYKKMNGKYFSHIFSFIDNAVLCFSPVNCWENIHILISIYHT